MNKDKPKRDQAAAARLPRQPEAILDVAEALMQRRGYNGFSYADIAEQLKCTKAALHYHFASKSELGRALIERYHTTFISALEAIEEETHDSLGRLRRYMRLYNEVLSKDRMCLCGMLAAEFTTLPRAMQTRLQRFFHANEDWLEKVLEQGRSAGQVFFRERSRERAVLLLGALEGAMLVARSFQEPKRLRLVAAHMLNDLQHPIQA